MKRPPRFGLWLMNSFMPEHIGKSGVGDYEEMFCHIAENNGKIRADLWFWGQVIRVLPVYFYESVFWKFVMASNYLKTAFRNMRKQKVFSFINISGLAAGMACFILIMLWVDHELSFNKFHENGENIYRVLKDDIHSPESAHIYGKLGPAIKEEIPEIIEMGRFIWRYVPLVKYNSGKKDAAEKSFYEREFYLFDPSIFDIFTFPFLKGDPKTALKNGIVITETMALKYFGQEDPMGKILNFDNEHNVPVTGVIRDIPNNSHIRFGMLSLLEDHQNLINWGNPILETYILLNEKTDLKDTERKIKECYFRHNPDAKSFLRSFRLQPLKDIYLNAGIEGWYTARGNIWHIHIFFSTALLILFIGCVNFMNMNTARSTSRAREVGLRKVLGANRSQLVKQFLGESFLSVFISFAISLVFVILFLPAFNNFVNKNLVLDLTNTRLLAGLSAVMLITGILAGFYPSFYMSRFKPVKVLKGLFFPKNRSGPFNVRKALVIIQFSISLILIICTVVITGQLNFLKNTNLGFDKKNIIYMNTNSHIEKKYETVKAELLKNSDITGVTIKDIQPQYLVWNTNIVWEGRKSREPLQWELTAVGYDYIDLMGLDLLEGRNFSREISSDKKNAFIVNEEAVKEMGLSSPIGKAITVEDWKKGVIIGVVKNARFKSMKSMIKPLFLYLWNKDFKVATADVILVKIRDKKFNSATAHINDIWSKFSPDYPFRYSFLKEDYENLYRSEKYINTIIIFFTSLAVILSCLGLFGLATFTAEQRTKEIGIRKVLGASVFRIAVILSGDFTKWVVFANLIAWPAAWYITDKWLQNFAYHIDVGIWIFLLSGSLALFLAILTVSWQAVRSASANPVDSLKYE